MEKGAVKAVAEGQKRTLGGKYLTFRMEDEEYGLEIIKVREIIGMMDITPVPCTPVFILGVINLRGKVIPVMDLRQKFGMPSKARTKYTCIVVVDIGTREIGMVVDSVSEVMDIASGDIDEPPAFGENVHTEFILGMGKVSSHVNILLDIGLVLTSDEISALPTRAPDEEEERGLDSSNGDEMEPNVKDQSAKEGKS